MGKLHYFFHLHPRTEVNQEVNGETALIAASEKLHTDIVVLLLRHRHINVNKEHTMTGKTALIISAGLYRGHDTVKTLLSNPQIDVNARDAFGASAFDYAASKAHLRTVKLLLQCPKVAVSADDAMVWDMGTDERYFRDDIAQMIAGRETLSTAGKTCCIQTGDGLLQAATTGDLLALRGRSSTWPRQ